MKKTLVISAIALRSGGTLSILHDCLHELNKPLYSDWKIFAFVVDPSGCRKINANIEYIALNAASNYLKRMYLEYFYFRNISKSIKPDLWLGLHDITAVVYAKRQAIYCHNPALFYKIRFRDFLLDPVFGFFNLFYHFFYRINIHRNDFIIVQQDWLRVQFADLFKLPFHKIVVARPNIFFPHLNAEKKHTDKTLFIFPTLPRVFKNVELIGEASRLLLEQGITGFQVLITISGQENAYAKWIFKKFSNVSALNFIGKQPRENIFKLYHQCECLIFPSKLETWGLPISEFKETNKNMLLADLPYAHETVGDYEKVNFFSPDSSADLAEKMKEIIFNVQTKTVHKLQPIKQPLTNNWTELLSLLMT
jgi:glycosyltransferase involved in cell wall biosynthesis